MEPDGVYSTLALVVAGIGFLVGIVGNNFRKKSKRIAMVSGGFMALTLGAWLLISTLEANAQGLAHVFSRRTAYFAKNSDLLSFELSFWFHAILGVVIILCGLFCMVMPFTRAWLKIKEQIYFE